METYIYYLGSKNKVKSKDTTDVVKRKEIKTKSFLFMNLIAISSTTKKTFKNNGRLDSRMTMSI